MLNNIPPPFVKYMTNITNGVLNLLIHRSIFGL